MFLLLLPDYPFECLRINSTRLDQQVIIGWVLGLSDKSSETSSCAFRHFTNSHVFASVFRWISQWYYHQLRPWMVQVDLKPLFLSDSVPPTKSPSASSLASPQTTRKKEITSSAPLRHQVEWIEPVQEHLVKPIQGSSLHILKCHQCV